MQIDKLIENTIKKPKGTMEFFCEGSMFLIMDGYTGMDGDYLSAPKFTSYYLNLSEGKKEILTSYTLMGPLQGSIH